MKYTTVDTQPVADHSDRASCCNRAEMVWMIDEILLAAQDNRHIPTDAIDQLPPWRARLVVGVALRAGATLQHGTPDTFDTAVVAAGMAGVHAAGWWRNSLGMPARTVYRPPPDNDSPPAGWTVKPNP